MSDGGKGSSPRPFSVDHKTFENNWDRIFSKGKSLDVTAEEEEAWQHLERKNMTPKVEDMKKGTCGCGRSPTGDCIGWHGLSEEQFQLELSKYRERVFEEKTREE